MTSVSSRRLLSLWLRRFSTDRAQRGVSPECAFALVGAVKSARVLTAVNDEAARLGLREGMSFADACAMRPGFAWAEAEPDKDERFLNRLAEWCTRYTPLVGLHPPDGLILDIGGSAHLFGGEKALSRDLAARLAAQGFRVRIGIAESAGGAWAAARFGKTLIIPAGELRAALAPLPLAALRLGPDVLHGLAQLGLKRVEDIMARPRAPLAARFGSETMRRLDQAMGREDEPLMPLLPVAPYSVEQGFPEPLLRDEDLLAVLAYLTRRLCALLETRGEGARTLAARFFGVDGAVRSLALGTSKPLRDPALLDRLFGEKFARQSWPDSFGFDRIRLSALVAESIAPAQTDWNAGEDCPGLDALCDRLAARLGPARVLAFMDQDSHVPEAASVTVPVQSAAEFSRKLAAPQQDSLVPARPVRLLARPEPIETIAEVPDGPPVRFRWRRVLHEVRRAEGPERIAVPWWGTEAQEAATRDYFRIEAAGGARLWLYREGVYSRETAQPRWFLHGFLP